jgi:3-deoxy-D-manno-octulosonate 8-phosphate phosphatase (KDO 8-P phosphatase)
MSPEKSAKETQPENPLDSSSILHPRSSILDPPSSILHSPTAATTLAERCRRIALLVLDVDGVLTDGAIIYGSGSVEVKAFHVRDGAGLKVWHAAGKRTVLISGRASSVVEVRAAELGIATVMQGAADKLAAYRQILAAQGLTAEQACCVGDDLVDVPLLANCGLAVAVADGCVEARAAAHYVTRAPGGRGAVREVIELVLRCQGTWRQ